VFSATIDAITSVTPTQATIIVGDSCAVRTEGSHRLSTLVGAEAGIDHGHASPFGDDEGLRLTVSYVDGQSCS
jgi:hypothetical protein